MSTVITDKKTSNTKLNELEQIKKFTTVVADTADSKASASSARRMPRRIPVWFTRRRRR